jgi:hypothetical protein
MIGFAVRQEHRRPEGLRAFPSGRLRFRLAEVRFELGELAQEPDHEHEKESTANGG